MALRICPKYLGLSNLHEFSLIAQFPQPKRLRKNKPNEKPNWYISLSYLSQCSKSNIPSLCQSYFSNQERYMAEKTKRNQKLNCPKDTWLSYFCELRIITNFGMDSWTLSMVGAFDTTFLDISRNLKRVHIQFENYWHFQNICEKI